jgi:orotidine-5'-phosphate decarboxylase
MPARRIVFPLDYPTLDAARTGVERVRGNVGVLKVGLELFVKEGPAAFDLARESGLDLFADLKLHDIPETVERAVAAAASSGARFLTVHAAGGTAMLERAVERARRESERLIVLAVTVLTSLDASDLGALGVSEPPREHVLRLARLAWSAGVRGFVCSPAEVALLRSELGPEAVLVTPGVRPAGADAGDQKRIATPQKAVADGADFIVVGRPIRDAPDPAAAARAIADEVAAGLHARGGAAEPLPRS